MTKTRRGNMTRAPRASRAQRGKVNFERFDNSRARRRQARWAERLNEQPKRRVGILTRINRRAPWLKVSLVVVALVMAGVSAWIYSLIDPELKEKSTTATVSGPRLSDGLTLGNLALVEVPSQVTGATETPRPVVTVPEVLPAPLYAPRDAGVEGRKLVALTFDDGPMDTTTPRLLDVLKEKRVKATFFVLGRQVRAHPEIVQRAEQEGHEVESHSMHHTNYYYLTLAEVQADAGEMNTVLNETVGHGQRYTRVPYGLYNDTVRAGVGTPLIGWSVDARDWEYQEADAVRRGTVTTTFDGAIVLLHDIYPSTVDAVGGIIDDLKNYGYEFVTVAELAAERGVTLEPGAVYLSL